MAESPQTRFVRSGDIDLAYRLKGVPERWHLFAVERA
jgi:hypothetical protein